jgi:hypothetical protein
MHKCTHSAYDNICKVKILILVMKAPYAPWDQLFENCAERTWAQTKQLDCNLKILKYCGNPLPRIVRRAILFIQSRSKLKFLWYRQRVLFPKAQLKQDTITVEIYDTWNSMFKKFLGALAWILKNEEFDYLVRINSTAYINLDNLRTFLETKVDYAGPSNGKKFASGWAIILSRNAVERMVEYVKVNRFMPVRSDDHIVSEVMKKNNMEITFFPATNYGEGILVNKKSLEKFVMIRVKNVTPSRPVLDSRAFARIHYALASG